VNVPTQIERRQYATGPKTFGVIDRNCEQCGKAFKARVAEVNAGNGRFCGMRCVYAHLAKESLPDRFWRNVNKTETCWLWTASTNPFGYGVLRYRGRSLTMHRQSWELHFGPIPDGLCVLHKCDVPQCVRPDHLFIGTKKDNMQDASRKGRTSPQTMRDVYVRAGRASHSKLTEDDVRAIRAGHAAGSTLKALGERHGLTKAGVSLIVRRKTWTDVA
jgi:hypothetical protein